MMTNRGVKGIIYMSLFFSWLLFIPFYGPGYSLITSTPVFVHFFTLGHIGGMIHSGIEYTLKKSQQRIQFIEKISVYIMPILVLLSLSQYEWLDCLNLILMGYFSGWIVIRWASWLSQPQFSSVRGLMMGLTIALTNIILYINTIFLRWVNESGWLVLASSTLFCLLGSRLIMGLEIYYQEQHIRAFSLKSVKIPWHILIFGIFAYPAGGFLYEAVYTVQVEIYSWVRELTIFAYIIGAAVFGYLSNRLSRIILVPSSFVIMGMGFTLWILNKGFPVIQITSEILILLGMACADLFYWLALADGIQEEDIPLTFAVGLAVHLLAISVAGETSKYFLIEDGFWFSPVGLVGTLIMFLGIFFSFGTYRQFCPNENDELEQASEVMDAVAATTPLNVRPENEIHNPEGDHILDSLLTEKYKLTQREKELTRMILQGYSYPQIAEQLFVTPNTVKYHVRNILRKTDTNNRHDLCQMLWEYLS